MSASGHYDQTLLADAPQTTKQQFQEGYTTDLLTSSRAVPTPRPTTPERTPSTDAESGLVAKEGTSHTKSLPVVPFWRSTKALLIFISVIVVLAVVIGAAVGATSHKHKNTGFGQSPPSSGTGTNTGDAGSAPTPTPHDPQSGGGGGPPKSSGSANQGSTPPGLGAATVNSISPLSSPSPTSNQGH